jgi:ribosomal protein S27E
MLSRFGSSKQIKWQWQAKVLKVNINGAERTLDATAGLGEDVIHELAGHLGMEIQDLQSLLHLGHMNQSEVVNVSPTQGNHDLANVAAHRQQMQGVRKRIVMINCPKCGHRIAEAAWCLYCGHELASAAGVEQSINEVDREFLENDIKLKNKTEGAVKQSLRDTFGDRLKDM